MVEFNHNELEYARQSIAERCEGSLFNFIRWSWPIIEPGRQFKSNWHIEAICEHLEAVSRGEIRNLLINMPPRHMKSTIVSVMWTPWTWLTKPHVQFLYASYAQSLSVRDSIKARRILEHPDYQELFKPEWSLTHDQNQKMKFVNTEMGHRLATSVGGAATGEGGDIIVVDDPHSKTDSKSDTIRTGQCDWWKETMSTRGNDPQTVCKVVVMQRLHEKDLSGEIIEGGKYEHLLLPAEFDSSRAKVTSIGWRDPRTKDKELLWPEHFTREVLDDMAKEMGPTEAEGQLNQNPQPAGGGTFNREWWHYYDQVDRNTAQRIWQFWDCAEEPGVSNDFSVCATWGEFSDGFYLLDLWRGKVIQADLYDVAEEVFEKWRPNNVVIERKSAGSGLFNYLAQRTKIPVQGYSPKLPKTTRALNATPTVAAGRCHIPRDAKWVCRGTVTTIEDFVKEHERFPLSAHDDTVDTTSMMVEHFNTADRQQRVRRL